LAIARLKRGGGGKSTGGNRRVIDTLEQHVLRRQRAGDSQRRGAMPLYINHSID